MTSSVKVLSQTSGESLLMDHENSLTDHSFADAKLHFYRQFITALQYHITVFLHTAERMTLRRKHNHIFTNILFQTKPCETA